MSSANDCTQNTNQLKLIREGTSQDQRLALALDPAYAPVDERAISHRIVFAQAYAKHLKHFDLNNTETGEWQPFFSEDVSAQLAVAAVQDIAAYRQKIREWLDFLSDRRHENDKAGLRDHLDYLFSCCATVAIRLDLFKVKLPSESALKKTLQNLVQSQLAPALRRLIAYRKGGEAIGPTKKPINSSSAEKAALEIIDGQVIRLRILGGDAVKFSELAAANLSQDWSNGVAWPAYYHDIDGDKSVYGTGTTVFALANHFATHNLFTSILDQFLKVFARSVGDAEQALARSFTEWDRHEPHYTLFLAFLLLLEYARVEMNTLTGRHLDFYYREILRLKEKGAKPGQVHLLVELAKQVDSHEFKNGALFKAGKDDLGRDAFFANDRDFVANQAKVAALRTVYRHGAEKVGTTTPTDIHQGRLYASKVANSDDGLGAKLTAVDQSWQPFYNKMYQGGVLAEIKMPKAEIGFAIASHYLWMAEGTRTVTVVFTLTTALIGFANEHKNDVVCQFTVEKGWIEKTAATFIDENGKLKLEISLSGEDPAVMPYAAKTHGYDFATDLPMLLVKLRHQDTAEYKYPLLQEVEISKIDLTVNVQKMKTLAVSNDFGPVDTSKPFQPYGPSPSTGNALTIGAKEIFQKNLTSAAIGVTWLTPPAPYPSTLPVTVTVDFLKTGQWMPAMAATNAGSIAYALTNNLAYPVVDEPDLTPNEFYNTTSRHGFTRLKLTGDLGQNTFQTDLLKYLRKETGALDPGKPPVGPTMSALWMDYVASQPIVLDSSDGAAFAKRQARFFHVAPFGQAEQHSLLNSAQQVFLLPQFDFKQDDANQESDAAEFYIGVTGFKPPQNLALLFQVADGTADPLSEKPKAHIRWSYLAGNEWLPFAQNDVEDQTGGLLNSGIVTFAMPRDASAANTLLPTGMHWLRAAVATEPDAVCRLRLVAAQALAATFTDKGNDLAFPGKVLQAGTISKLDQPDAAVKKITQPFPTFGGRGKEASTAFYTRISERLRHKDRAIALWDYERLVLEAFPQIYKAKCLNHTRYEPSESGEGIYRELAPGHVTVVTIPNQQFHHLRDPLRPYTSLGLLEEIAVFLSRRLSCFVKLHVKNPQFEEVQVDCKVRLHEGFDETFYANKLAEAITRFLSPWAFAGGDSPSFGGKIYKSALINFVEDLPYVDYVTDFQLFHSFLDSDAMPQNIEKNVVEGSKAVSILVSAKQHIIKPFKPAEVETPAGEKCTCDA
jgi:hypothetical protein